MATSSTDSAKLWHSITLLVFGALIGVVPTQIASCSRQAFEREQMFLQQKLTAFQNYSKAYNVGMSVVYGEIQQTVVDRGKVTALSKVFTADRIGPIVSGRASALAKLTSDLMLADAEMRTQTVVINALFQQKIEPITFLTHIDDPNLGKANFTPYAEFEQELQSELETFQKESTKIKDTFNRNIKILESQLTIEGQ